MEGQAARFKLDVEGMLLNWVNYVHNLIDIKSEPSEIWQSFPFRYIKGKSD